MRKRDRRELERYIRYIANEVELRDWTITLMGEPAAEGKLATIAPTYGRKLAHLRVCAGFRSLPPDEQRVVIVHELVHCHWAAAVAMVGSDLEEAKALDGQADHLFYVSFKRQMEYAVDATLIEWP